MSEPVVPATVADCWNRIGVRGDHSCERLEQHAHCRNCEVFGAAAHDMMQRELPAGYRREWREYFASAPPKPRHADRSVLVFRIGVEWLALPTRLALLAADPVRPRRLPHRTDPVVLGIANIQGQLYPCLSLARLLGTEERQPPRKQGTPAYARTLVMQFEQLTAALPVHDLLGVHRYAAEELEAAPAAVAQAEQRYIDGILHIDGRRVGMLDAQLVGYNLARRLK